ncbi:disease resistance protein PIK6-NP-like [Panicum virgatum]|uniref:disease resistance protein PIK6-NP-like n=1 Tax=Panicum virgatum TaxID=38727 RepID=UPI0019D530C8|nr:disease resistance protein PIK6-NP-like [Panicum virgatum]
MAELTSGAVTTLLGLIRDETLMLSGVRGDVQFIRQEMESMKSFLAHLGRTAPPGGEHDEQVRAWTNQVQLLAQDCNNCITTYRYYGDPDIHRARDGLRRYMWWLPWFVRKVAAQAQHDAAIRLRELKDQARDIGERRQRYGVEVPARAAGSGSPFPVPFDDVDDEAEQAVSPEEEEAVHGCLRAVLEARSLDDYFRGKLGDWMQDAKKDKKKTMSVAIMAPHVDPDKVEKEVLDAARAHFKRILVVDINKFTAAQVGLFDFFSFPLQPFDILYDVLDKLQRQEGTSAGGQSNYPNPNPRRVLKARREEQGMQQW